MQKRMPVRKDREGVSPVIATILMVAITVVLAAVLYVMVSGLIVTTEIKPLVTLRGDGCSAGTCRGTVTGADREASLDRFRVVVLADEEPLGAPRILEAGRDLAFGNVTFRYVDLGGEGKLSAGDSFRLSGASLGIAYQISLLWKDGSEVAKIGVSV